LRLDVGSADTRPNAKEESMDTKIIELERLRNERTAAATRAAAIRIPAPGDRLDGEQLRRFLEEEKIATINRRIMEILG